jgi:Flp pilus assembly protein TadB
MEADLGSVRTLWMCWRATTPYARRPQVSKTQSAHRPNTSSLWQWVVGAFLLGFVVSILMPPLLLVLIAVVGAWGLVRWGHQTPSRRTAIAIDLGLGMAAVLYLAIWIVGSVSR